MCEDRRHGQKIELTAESQVGVEAFSITKGSTSGNEPMINRTMEGETQNLPTTLYLDRSRDVSMERMQEPTYP